MSTRSSAANYEVIHHTQLLARLVAEGKLKPAGRVDEKLTYHDPCFLGRHNKVYTPPREILEAVPGVQATEMHRCKERGFCCGAGGARMWMEERIGKRINTERIEEALALSPDTISTSCPYCLVMLGNAVSAKKSSGEAKETLEVVDVAQLLARSVHIGPPADTRGRRCGRDFGRRGARRHGTQRGQPLLPAIQFVIGLRKALRAREASYHPAYPSKRLVCYG